MVEHVQGVVDFSSEDRKFPSINRYTRNSITLLFIRRRTPREVLAAEGDPGGEARSGYYVGKVPRGWRGILLNVD